MEASAATAATLTAAALSECWIWRKTKTKSKTDESGKCEKGSEKAESAHDLYLPPNLGVQFRASSLLKRLRAPA
jgi:hypothetical protein